jgi:hypothetical protein
MGWIAELYSDLVAGPSTEEQQAFDRELARLRNAREGQHTVDDRVKLLEDDLARMLLLLHAVTEAVVSKGVISQSDLETAGREIDLRDGKADGKLDPACERPEERAPTAHAELTPGEYLAVIEEQARRRASG